MAGFDDQHQAHRRFLQLDSRFGIGKLRAIDDIGPIDKVVEIRHRITKYVLRQMRDEFRARFVAGVVKFVSARVPPEMRFILSGQKRALMMIEPPGQFVRGAVFEIHNDVFIRTEKILADLLSGLVRQTFVFDDRAGIKMSLIKTRENCG